MGEAKRKSEANGHTGYLLPKRRIRLVSRLLLENQDADGLTILMLGDREPELATAMTPSEARRLAAELMKHADAVERAQPPIIVPGGLIHA